MSADILPGLRAIVTGATQASEYVAGPVEHRTVDRIPVVMIREAADEIERLRALQPPGGLPATLATVDDVRAVCKAAGLRNDGADDVWGRGEVVVSIGTSRLGRLTWVLVSRCVLDDRDVSGVRYVWGNRTYRDGPTELLWRAIQDARLGEAVPR